MRYFGIAAACAVALLSLPAPSFAEQTPPPTPSAAEGQPPAQQPASGTPEQAPQDPKEVICKRLEAETGTRLGKRKECRTREEWDQIAEEARQELEKTQTNK